MTMSSKLAVTYSHRLSFRARHNEIDLSIIPATLGMTAHALWKAGDPRRTPKGTPLEGIRKDCYCSITFDELADLPQSLTAALAILKEHNDFLLSLSEEGVEFAFFVGWFSDSSSGDTLQWQLLDELAKLRISLELDVYGPEGQPS